MTEILFCGSTRIKHITSKEWPFSHNGPVSPSNPLGIEREGNVPNERTFR